MVSRARAGAGAGPTSTPTMWSPRSIGPAPAPWCSRDPSWRIRARRALPALAAVMGREVVRLPGDDDAAAWVVAVAGALAGEGADAARRLQVLVGATAAPALPRRPVGARAARVPALRPGVLARWAGCAWRPCGRCAGGGLPGAPAGAAARRSPRGGAVIPRRRRGALWMALAGAAGLLAVLLTLRASAQPDGGGWVLVARTPLPPGLLIDDAVAAEALAPAPVPAGLELAGLLASAEEAIGRRTAAPVDAGEPLTQAALGGAPGVGAAPLARGRARGGRPALGRRRRRRAGSAARALTSSRRPARVSSGRTRVVVADAEVLATTEAAPEGDLGGAGEALLRVTAAAGAARDGGAQLRAGGPPAGAPAATRRAREPPPAGRRRRDGPLVVAGAARAGAGRAWSRGRSPCAGRRRARGPGSSSSTSSAATSPGPGTLPADRTIADLVPVAAELDGGAPASGALPHPSGVSLLPGPGAPGRRRRVGRRRASRASSTPPRAEGQVVVDAGAGLGPPGPGGRRARRRRPRRMPSHARRSPPGAPAAGRPRRARRGPPGGGGRQRRPGARRDRGPRARAGARRAASSPSCPGRAARGGPQRRALVVGARGAACTAPSSALAEAIA